MINNYTHTFFTQARLAEFWEMVTGLVKLASPGVLISVAITLTGMLIVIAIVAFRKGADNERESDREYDIKYYD